MRKHIPVLAMLAASMVLGATVFREPIARAGQALTATIIGPLDSNGNVAVHEQGIAKVNVMNGSVAVAPVAATRFESWDDTAVPNSGHEYYFADGPMDASLVTFSSIEGTAHVEVLLGQEILLSFGQQNPAIVVPLAQPLTIDGFRLYCYSSSPTDCAAKFHAVGR